MLSPRCLTAGLTGAEKRHAGVRGIKGKFGDGLQSAVNVLSKGPSGCELSLVSVGHRFEFESRAKLNCVHINTLHYTIQSLFSTSSNGAGNNGVHRQGDMKRKNVLHLFGLLLI